MSGINNLGGHNVNNSRPLETAKELDNQEQDATRAKRKTKEHALDFSLYIDRNGNARDNGDGNNGVVYRQIPGFGDMGYYQCTREYYDTVTSEDGTVTYNTYAYGNGYQTGSYKKS